MTTPRLTAPLGSAGLLGLGGITLWIGQPTWVHATLFAVSVSLATTSAVNTVITRGRQQHTTARLARIAADDEADRIATRTRIRSLLAVPTVTGKHRRALERTYRKLDPR